MLDALDVRQLAEFYRELLGYTYRSGDESGDHDWLVLRPDDGPGFQLAFQEVGEQPPSTWPDARIPQQLHLDLTVPTADDLAAEHERVLSLGGEVLEDRFDDPEEPLYVFADPAGHPFCIFPLQEDVAR